MAMGQENDDELVVQYRDRLAQFFTENGLELTTEKTALEMVFISVGEFMMGSPENELEHRKNESPQHQVTIAQPFFMGKYSVTQAQWKAVATTLPKINQDLEPEPSRFSNDNHPVERVSWHDAIEFCARLRQHTERPYRLPTEAEWEYACRANTNTPFHFGPTLTTTLANYRGTDWTTGDNHYSGTYNSGPPGTFQEQTTPVGSFDVANAFGFYDMHGNVWEWCQDVWHPNYNGAPTDGSAWTTGDDTYRVLRGGSWINGPADCRSARRMNSTPDARVNYYGFRVVCG
ncbi:MAG: formylglycine-generating enzyme family protein [Cyanobacteria bacterium P01_F01_bin.13]